VKYVCQGKKYLSNSTTIPLTIMSAKKKYFTLNFIHLEHKAYQILFTLPISVTVFHLQSVPSTSSHSLPKFPTSSMPLHNTSVSSNALDIQHLLKPFTLASDEMYCHAVMIHVDYIFLCLHTCTHEDDSLFLH
jgi:hypothetical protein